MQLEEIRKEFVAWMEKVHAGLAYPRNFFGCLAAIVIEENAVTQERIQKLTGYSRATVSLALQKIQLHLPVRVNRKPGERKHYYQYEGDAERFLVALGQQRVETPDLDTALITGMLAKKQFDAPQNEEIQSFRRYLTTFRFHSELMYSMRMNYTSEFENALSSGNLKDGGLPPLRTSQRKEIEAYQKKIAKSKAECSE